MNNASFKTEDRIAVDASAGADDPNKAGVEPLHGNGFYRFNIGDFRTIVISDGHGPIPVRPIFVMNVSEAELDPVLKANFMQPVIQVTNNPLVVDTGHERILVDTGFGEKLGLSFGNFPGLGTNLGRAGITPEIRIGITGPAAVSKAMSTVRRCQTRLRRARLGQLERTCRRSPTDPGS
jgi:hypothetical protein